MFKDNIATLLRAIELDDKNLIRRVWRRNTVVRKELSIYDFQRILGQYFPSGGLLKNLLEFLDNAIAVHEKVNKDEKVPPSVEEDGKDS